MGLMDLFKTKPVKRVRRDKATDSESFEDLENDEWIYISIAQAGSYDHALKVKAFYERYAGKMGWVVGFTKFDTNRYKPPSGQKLKGDYYQVCMAPENGMISPKQLSLNLLTLRQLALWSVNLDILEKKKRGTIWFVNFDWFIDKDKSEGTYYLVVEKNGLEMQCDLRKLIQLYKQNPGLTTKAFYFSLKKIYNQALKTQVARRPEEVVRIFNKLGFKGNAKSKIKKR